VPPPPEPTAQLYIAFWTELDFGAVNPINLWTFYTPAVGSSWSVCEYIGSVDAPRDVTLPNVPFPSGTIRFTWDVMGTSGCSYTGTATSPGTLSCPDLTLPVQCEAVTYKELECYEQLGVAEVIQMVWCAWN
jgi:hypothetical protein